MNDPKELEAARVRAAGTRPEIDPWTRSELLEFIDYLRFRRFNFDRSKLRQLNRIVALSDPDRFGDRKL